MIAVQNFRDLLVAFSAVSTMRLFCSGKIHTHTLKSQNNSVLNSNARSLLFSSTNLSSKQTVYKGRSCDRPQTWSWPLSRWSPLWTERTCSAACRPAPNTQTGSHPRCIGPLPWSRLPCEINRCRLTSRDSTCWTRCVRTGWRVTALAACG